MAVTGSIKIPMKACSLRALFDDESKSIVPGLWRISSAVKTRSKGEVLPDGRLQVQPSQAGAAARRPNGLAQA